MNRLKALRKEIRSIETIGGLLDWFTRKRLERFSFFFLLVFTLSPLYAMLWSLFFARHVEAAYIGNLLGLAGAWHTLIIQLGYIGVVVAAILLAKAVREAKASDMNPSGFLRKYLIEGFLGLFIIWTALATIFSINPSLSLEGDYYRKEGLWTFGAYLGIFALAKTQSRANIIRLAVLFLGVSTFLSVLAVINSDTLNLLFTLKKKTSIFHNANHYGYYLVMSLMVSTLLFLNLRTLKSPFTLPLLIFHALLSVVIIENHSFGAFLALAATFVAVLTLVAWLRRGLLARTVLLVVLFFGVSWGQGLADDYLASEIEGTREDVANIVEGNEDAASAGTGRWSLWTHALEFTLEKPFFGYGPDTLGVPFEEAGENTDRPHNEFLQFAASQGLPALIFYLGAIITLAVSAFRKRHALPVLTLTLGFVVMGYLASSMFGNTMYYTTPFYVMFLSFTVSGVKSASKPQAST